MSSWEGHRVDHVGIAVRDLDQALARYRELFRVDGVQREEAPLDGVEVAFLELAGATVELLASRRPGSPVERFLERRGEGLHHLALEVPDIEADLLAWRERGAELVDERARPGSRGRLVAFLHPRSFDGVLIELCQRR